MFKMPFSRYRFSEHSFSILILSIFSTSAKDGGWEDREREREREVSVDIYTGLTAWDLAVGDGMDPMIPTLIGLLKNIKFG